MLTQTILNGREITYTLKRSKRKYIGLKIDRHGLSICAPLQAPLSRVETVLQEKANWITEKLEHWENKKSLAPTWAHDAAYPLLGEPWRIALKPSGEIQMMQQFSDEMPDPTFAEQLLTQLNPHQIEKFVMAWYDQRAINCYKERIAVYAQKLNLCPPPFRLSRAKNRWGSCSARGMIYLNWCLIQLPLHLIDYVVAHELSHLIEMNHSAAFWRVVESVYPDYRPARRALREYG
ncbi:M48 family metallopeptidase [Nitrosomonas sp. Nm166]|uniref:M48 family metallopeptidase n=1 Tax=Nitrosomonas sp. Nm166 TaxID=1881054 RepID=UPI0008F1B30F|nr:SprT family zinc-dependent metalloprotease [Nitrosomonas sp. Nm166]SFE00363.1 hypothetical protein SAMN05428977_1004110 [Nitrosomonas sp. Nm166]